MIDSRIIHIPSLQSPNLLDLMSLKTLSSETLGPPELILLCWAYTIIVIYMVCMSATWKN